MARINTVVKLAIMVVTASAATSCPAQSFPSKPIRIIVGSTAGGGIDIVARSVGHKLGERYGQPIIVDNRPGAGTTIGGEAASKAAADGHTMFMASTSFAISAGLYRKLSYDPVRDLTGVSLVASGPLVLVVHPSVPANKVSDLIRLAKDRPGRLTFASGGTGSSLHLAGELFKLRSGVNIVHVPYKGGAPAAVDLMGGQVDLMFDVMIGLLPHVKSGRVRPLAVTTPTRAALLPDVPTMKESGMSDFEVAGWFGLLTPSGTGKDQLSALSAAIVWAVAQPDVQAKLVALGADPVGSSAESFQSYFRGEVTRWRTLIESLGLAMN